jgi:hypothetical protein
LRDQLATAALAQARTVERQATLAQRRANEAVVTHAAQRRAAETDIYQRLLAGKLPSRQLQTAAARLSGIAAYDAALRRRSVQAVQEQARCAQAAVVAQQTRARRLRKAEATGLLHGTLIAERAVLEEWRAETELEEVPVRGAGSERPGAAGSGDVGWDDERDV